MQHRITRFATALIALLLSLTMHAASLAQGTGNTYSHATSNGRYKLDGVNGTAVNVNVFDAYYAASNVTEIWGTMSIVSNTIFADTSVAIEHYSTVTLQGVAYKHVDLTSRLFTYTNYATLVSAPAYLMISLTQSGPSGQAGFKVVRAADGAILAESAPQGVYTEVPFLIGGVTITE